MFSAGAKAENTEKLNPLHTGFSQVGKGFYVYWL